jgi:hypothetical protein
VLQVVPVQPAVDLAGEELEVALGQLLHDGPLVGEELVQRTHGDPGPLGDQRGGHAVVAELVDQRRARVQHLFHAPGAAPLDRLLSQRNGGRHMFS